MMLENSLWKEEKEYYVSYLNCQRSYLFKFSDFFINYLKILIICRNKHKLTKKRIQKERLSRTKDSTKLCYIRLSQYLDYTIFQSLRSSQMEWR